MQDNNKKTSFDKSLSFFTVVQLSQLPICRERQNSANRKRAGLQWKKAVAGGTAPGAIHTSSGRDGARRRLLPTAKPEGKKGEKGSSRTKQSCSSEQCY
jgi:hypothetical protein